MFERDCRQFLVQFGSNYFAFWFSSSEICSPLVNRWLLWRWTWWHFMFSLCCFYINFDFLFLYNFIIILRKRPPSLLPPLFSSTKGLFPTQVFSVIRESVSFQVCPEFLRTIIWSGRGPGAFGGRQGGSSWERHSEVRDLAGEVKFEFMFKMPVAQPVVDLSYNCKKLVREQKITGPSHTCTFFSPPPLSPFSF